MFPVRFTQIITSLVVASQIVVSIVLTAAIPTPQAAGHSRDVVVLEAVDFPQEED